MVITMTKKNIHIATIILITVLTTTYMHYAKTLTSSPHVYFGELYYLPLFLAATRFGLKGALLTYLLISAAYITLVWGGQPVDFPWGADRALHLIFTGLFAVVSGKMAERDGIKRRQIEQERYFAGIGQASTIIVHDLKNPLISIQGFARRIQAGKGDITKAAETILASANTMQRIVNDVLEFAKPLRMDFHNEDIRETIRRACETCRTKAAESGVTLTDVHPPEPVNSAIDSFQLSRALVNLIDNSVDASPRGGIVTVSAVCEKNKLTITIKDNGIGMDSETLDSIFELTYTTKNEGTGFGVPISKKIIDAHSGEIRVKSQKGIGTEVTIELPIKKTTKPVPFIQREHS